MKLNRGKVPPGGWHFKVAEGVILTAGIEADLIKQIFEYRLRNNIPIGNIERDIDDYYCAKGGCHKEPKDYAQSTTDERAPLSESLLSRVTRWASELIHRQPKGGYPTVSPEEAARRGNICVGCPKNQPWRIGCKGCSNNTAVVLSSIRKMQTSKRASELAGCKICGWDNETAVWMPVEGVQIDDATKNELPDRCWRKSL